MRKKRLTSVTQREKGLMTYLFLNEKIQERISRIFTKNRHIKKYKGAREGNNSHHTSKYRISHNKQVPVVASKHQGSKYERQLVIS